MTSKFTGLPTNWTIRNSKTKNHEYYFNKSTQESQWTPPVGTDQATLDAYLSKGLHNPTKVHARHLLVKHKDVRRPSSWKEEHITRTKQDAIEKIKTYLEEIERGDATLETLALENSDCSSHAKGGDLGFFERGQMQPSFEKAAFELQVGELSDIVESQSGVHIIERIG